MVEVTSALNSKVPIYSLSSTTNGPNASQVTGDVGQFLVDIGSNGTVFWVNPLGTSNGWKELLLSGTSLVSGTANRITVTGTSPSVIDIAATYVGQSSITTLGTIATGVWQGTQIVDTYLATISTAGKVLNSATTATSANTSSAIIARSSSGTFVATGATFTGVDASHIFRADSAVEITGAAAPNGGPGLSIFLTDAVGSTTGETFIAYGGCTDTGVVTKQASISAKWADATSATGRGVLRLNATYQVAGVQTDNVALRIFGNQGISVFGSSETTGPGGSIFAVTGAVTVSTTLNVTGVATVGNNSLVTGTSDVQFSLVRSSGDGTLTLAFDNSAAGPITVRKWYMQVIGATGALRLWDATASAERLSINTSGAITTGVWQGTAIVDTYLATISTAGKVANSATTATAVNTASTIVLRDGSNNFAAGTITAALTGNASTATKLATARAINGVDFDGSAAITVTAAAGTLTGATLAAGVTASSLTSVGTLTSLTVSGTITMTAAASKIVPGATSFSHRNNGDSADNLIITDAGAITVRSSITGCSTLTGLSGTDLTVAAAGASDAVILKTNGSNRWVIGSTGHILASTDNSYDIGASGAYRPRALYLAGAFGCNGKAAQSAVTADATVAGGVGTAAGGFDTAAHRDSFITLVNQIRSTLIANGIMA